VVHARSVPDGTILTFPRTLPSLLHTLSCFLTNELVHFRRELVAHSATRAPTHPPTHLPTHPPRCPSGLLSHEMTTSLAKFGPIRSAPQPPRPTAALPVSSLNAKHLAAHARRMAHTRALAAPQDPTFCFASRLSHVPILARTHHTTPRRTSPIHTTPVHTTNTACSGKRPTNTHHRTTTTKPTRHVTTRTRTPGQPHNQLRRTAPHGTMDAHQHNTSHHPLHQPRRAHAQNPASTRRVCLYRLCAALRQ
jgi:hypothetical protein